MNEDADVRLHHYDVLVETYRHHFDLFIKGVGLYILIVSALSGFMFSKESISNRSAVSALICGLSVISLIGLRPCYQWVRDIGKVIARYEDSLDLQALSLDGALGILNAVRNGIVIIAIGSFVGALAYGL